TMWAIFGFVIASIIVLCYKFDYNNLLTPLHIGIGCGCFVLVSCCFMGIVYWFKKRKNHQRQEETI
ncbi:MAG: hypothetical protein K2N42_04590, partial [Anaeroplasmataceae bacterium]|nr:hypothetical protein [Anaeroplasmataceae bacterium]